MMTEQNESLVGVYNLLIPQGADTTINLTYKVGGSVVDFSTHTAKLQVREDYGSAVLLELTSADNEIIVSNTAPNIIIKFPNAKTTAMTIFSGMKYDIELTSALGVVTRPLRGGFRLDREITL